MELDVEIDFKTHLQNIYEICSPTSKLFTYSILDCYFKVIYPI